MRNFILPKKPGLVTRRNILRSALAAPFIIRPRETTAFGLFPSGGANGCAGGLTPPAPAVTWGFNCLSLHDDFTSLSTVDTTNSQTPGFNWYIQGKWPQVSAGLNNVAWNSGPTLASDLSVTASVLTINNSQGDNFFSEMSLNTAYSTGVGSTYGGTVFSAGWYFEARSQYDPTLGNFSRWGTDPVFWFLDVGILTNTVAKGMEFDAMEALPGMPQFAQHEWTVATATSDVNDNRNWSYAPTDLSLPHTYGMLWVPMAKNGGTGLFQFFVDNVHVPAQDVSYSATGLVSPGASNNAPGLFSIGDTGHYCLMIGCGTAWPHAIDWLRLWQ